MHCRPDRRQPRRELSQQSLTIGDTAPLPLSSHAAASIDLSATLNNAGATLVSASAASSSSAESLSRTITATTLNIYEREDLTGGGDESDFDYGIDEVNMQLEDDEYGRYVFIENFPARRGVPHAARPLTDARRPDGEDTRARPR